jgi:hypothetical protein
VQSRKVRNKVYCQTFRNLLLETKKPVPQKRRRQFLKKKIMLL